MNKGRRIPSQSSEHNLSLFFLLFDVCVCVCVSDLCMHVSMFFFRKMHMYFDIKLKMNMET